MRIGFFTYDFYPMEGGQGRYVYEMLSRLSGRKDFRHELNVFSPCVNGIPYHKTVFAFTKRLGKNILYSVLLNMSLAKLVNDNKLDTVHAGSGPGGVFILHKPRVPLIVSAYHTYHQQSGKVKGQSWKRIFIPLEKKTYQLADLIITISESTKQALVRNYAISPDKIRIIPPGVDANTFRPAEKKPLPDSILFVGRLDERKGIDNLVKAMPEVVKEKPNATLYIIGRGKLESWIRDFAKEHGIEKNIRLLGFVADDQLVEWYNKASCAVVPSVFEGFGITAIEAMACGTPVIATKVDGLKDIITDGVNGLLVEYGNTKALAGTITKMFEDKNLQAKLIKEGLKTAREKYGLERIAGSMAMVYDEFNKKN